LLVFFSLITPGLTQHKEDEMKQFKILLIFSMALFVFSSIAVAGDFDWLRDFNIQAQADPSGFRARLATRFDLGDVQVNAVLSNFEEPADAYVALRLGEMSDTPTNIVVEEYKNNKGQGWGALAKSLGIKPGSEAFHALKRGHDLHDGAGRGQVLTSVRSDDHDKGSGKGKGKGKKRK
jgi:hypothetical protein